MAPLRLRMSRWVIKLAAITESNRRPWSSPKKRGTGAIRMAAPIPAVVWPHSRGGTPRSSAARTWRKVRPIPRWAPANDPFGVARPM